MSVTLVNLDKSTEVVDLCDLGENPTDNSLKKVISEKFDITLFEIEYEFPLCDGDEIMVKEFFCDSCNDIDVAIKSKHLDCVKKLWERNKKWTIYSFDNAVITGDIEIVKYLAYNTCHYSINHTRLACIHGNLECLKYLREIGCPWYPDTYKAAMENKNKPNVKFDMKRAKECEEYALKYTHFQYDGYRQYETNSPEYEKELRDGIEIEKIGDVMFDWDYDIDDYPDPWQGYYD